MRFRMLEFSTVALSLYIYLYIYGNASWMLNPLRRYLIAIHLYPPHTSSTIPRMVGTFRLRVPARTDPSSASLGSNPIDR